MSRGETLFPLRYPSMPEAGGKMGIRSGELPLPSGAVLGRVGPAPCLGITIETTLLVEMQVELGVEESCLHTRLSCSGKGRGEMPLPLTPYSLQQIMELTSPLPSVALRKLDPVPHLRSTVELTLLAEVRMRNLRKCKSGVTAPSPHQPCCGEVEGKMPPTLAPAP